jgi:predicted CoA-binding protein
MNKKTTLVVGASENERRYSNMAVQMLTNDGHPVYAYGLKSGNINGTEIQTQWPKDTNIDTVTMYVGTQRQADLYDKLKQLAPRRIIFNPGTENHELANILKQQGVEIVMHCTLVMLRGGLY